MSSGAAVDVDRRQMFWQRAGALVEAHDLVGNDEG